MKMTREEQTLLEEFCEENNYQLRVKYSGRGMYGDNCVGIVTGDSGITVMGKFAIFLVANLEPDEPDDLFDFPDFLSQ